MQNFHHVCFSSGIADKLEEVLARFVARIVRDHFAVEVRSCFCPWSKTLIANSNGPDNLLRKIEVLNQALLSIQTVRRKKSVDSWRKHIIESTQQDVCLFQTGKERGKSVPNGNQTFRRIPSSSVSKPVRLTLMKLDGFDAEDQEVLRNTDYRSEHFYHQSFPVWNKKASYWWFNRGFHHESRVFVILNVWTSKKDAYN